MSEKKTVLVKVAVAVDVDGWWYSAGCGCHPLATNEREALEQMHRPAQVYTLEGELPIPEDNEK